MNPFQDRKQMDKLYQTFLKNYDRLKGRDCTPEENADAQKHSWGEQ